MWMGPKYLERTPDWMRSPDRQKERKRFPVRILSPEEKEERLALILGRNPRHIALWRASKNNSDRKCATMAKLESYCHGRIALTLYQEPRGAVQRNKNRGWLARAARKGSNRLGLYRKVRQSFRVGGRLRFPAYPKRYTAYGRNLTRDAAHMLQTYPSGLCFFLTLTVPTSTEEGCKVLSAGSGYLVDRITGWLKRRILDEQYVYVWERQKRGSPHLHIMFRAMPFDKAQNVYSVLRRQWHKILCDLSEESGVDLFLSDRGGSWKQQPQSLNVDVKVVKRDFAAYISKYISKGESAEGATQWFNPGRWWGCSRSLRAVVQAQRTWALVRIPSVFNREDIRARFERSLQACTTEPLDIRDYVQWGSCISSVIVRAVSAARVGVRLVWSLAQEFSGLIQWVLQPEEKYVLLE